MARDKAAAAAHYAALAAEANDGKHTYERVTYRPEGAKRSSTILLGGVTTIPLHADGGRALAGVEVGPDGETIWRDGGTTERRHIIALELIRRRVVLRLNKHYGLLEENTDVS